MPVESDHGFVFRRASADVRSRITESPLSPEEHGHVKRQASSVKHTRRPRGIRPVLEFLEAKTLLSYTPIAMIPAGIYRDVVMAQRDAIFAAPTGFRPPTTAGSTSWTGSGSTSSLIAGPLSGVPALAAPNARPAGVPSGDDEESGGGDGEGGSSEDSGSSEDGDSGDDGNGGTYSWDDVSTWDLIQTWDGYGNTTSTNHWTHTYTYTDSGTTADGLNYSVTYNENDHQDGNGYSHSDGSSHYEHSGGQDASYTDHADHLGDTYDDGGTFHGTDQGFTDFASDQSITAGSTGDSHGADHYTAHAQDGSSTTDEGGSDFATDHNDGTLHLLNYYTVISSTSNTTHDGGGSEAGTTHLVNDLGDTLDSRYSGEDSNHNETHTTYDGVTGTGTTTANANRNDEEEENLDVAYADGDSYGFENHSSSQSQSSTDPTSGSTSSYSRDGGGSSYGDFASTDDEGNTWGIIYSDQFTNHEQGNISPGGVSTSNWTASGSGHDTYYSNFGTVDYVNVTGYDEDSYSASGGTDADGNLYATTTGEVHGGDNVTVHLIADAGETLDLTGSDYYQAQDTDGVDTETHGGSGTYTITHPDGTTTGGNYSYGDPTPPGGSSPMAQGLPPAGDQGPAQVMPAQQQQPQQPPPRRGGQRGNFARGNGLGAAGPPPPRVTTPPRGPAKFGDSMHPTKSRYFEGGQKPLTGKNYNAIKRNQEAAPHFDIGSGSDGVPMPSYRIDQHYQPQYIPANPTQDPRQGPEWRP